MSLHYGRLPPNGERYPLVGGLRLAVETEKSPKPGKSSKNAPRTHLSSARFVGQFLSSINFPFANVSLDIIVSPLRSFEW